MGLLGNGSPHAWREMVRILGKVPSVTFVMTRCVVSICNDTFLHFRCVCVPLMPFLVLNLNAQGVMSFRSQNAAAGGKCWLILTEDIVPSTD